MICFHSNLLLFPKIANVQYTNTNEITLVLYTYIKVLNARVWGEQICTILFILQSIYFTGCFCNLFHIIFLIHFLILYSVTITICKLDNPYLAKSGVDSMQDLDNEITMFTQYRHVVFHWLSCQGRLNINWL